MRNCQTTLYFCHCQWQIQRIRWVWIASRASHHKMAAVAYSLVHHQLLHTETLPVNDVLVQARRCWLHVGNGKWLFNKTRHAMSHNGLIYLGLKVMSHDTHTHTHTHTAATRETARTHLHLRNCPVSAMLMSPVARHWTSRGSSLPATSTS